MNKSMRQLILIGFILAAFNLVNFAYSEDPPSPYENGNANPEMPVYNNPEFKPPQDVVNPPADPAEPENPPPDVGIITPLPPAEGISPPALREIITPVVPKDKTR